MPERLQTIGLIIIDMQLKKAGKGNKSDCSRFLQGRNQDCHFFPFLPGFAKVKEKVEPVSSLDLTFTVWP